MKNIAMPTTKGQITIPAHLRKKYAIDDNSSIKFIDKGNGVIELRIMRLSEAVFVEIIEGDKSQSISFSKPVDPEMLINVIEKIDGQD